MPRVEIVIGRHGKTVINVINAQGSACKGVTERLSVSMGLTPLKEELKPEFFVENPEVKEREYA